MAEWRIFRGWSERELEARMTGLYELQRNFDRDPATLLDAPDWRHYDAGGIVGREPPGPPIPGGPFERGRIAVAAYEFSDPAIVEAHFDPSIPLGRRRLLLEIKVLGLHYLCGAAVGAVRNEVGEDASTFGFRYDTLVGHIERGAEWFRLSKRHDTGEIEFRIAADWTYGDFPNWWSRVGFALLGPHYQRRWHRAALLRLRRLLRGDVPPPVARAGQLVHEGPALDIDEEEEST